MSEPTRYMYSHKDLVTTQIKDIGVHEGLWMLTVQFGLGAANVENPEDQSNVNPAAIVPVVSIGILKTDTKNALTIDATKVNPAPGTERQTGQRKTAAKPAPKKNPPAAKKR